MHFKANLRQTAETSLHLTIKPDKIMTTVLILRNMIHASEPLSFSADIECTAVVAANPECDTNEFAVIARALPSLICLF